MNINEIPELPVISVTKLPKKIVGGKKPGGITRSERVHKQSTEKDIF